MKFLLEKSFCFLGIIVNHHHFKDLPICQNTIMSLRYYYDMELSKTFRRKILYTLQADKKPITN